jgi:hypothetical protein
MAPSLESRPYGIPYYLQGYRNTVDWPDALMYCNPGLVWRGDIFDAPGFRNVRVAEVALSQEEHCRHWLRALVAAGGPEKPKFCRNGGDDTAETSYWGEAKSTFGITRRGFEGIWGEITREHADWTKPGRRPDLK